MKNSIIFWIVAITVIVIAIIIGVVIYLNNQPAKTINNFAECVSANYPVIETYPRQCTTSDGRVFVEDIGNATEKADLIRVDNPQPNQVIISPLTITGQARGFWFFEAQFPVKLLDDNGEQITATTAFAQGEWMTNNFVPFTATLEFEIPQGSVGTLILEKDNPSDLPQNADRLIIPVRFKGAEQTNDIH